MAAFVALLVAAGLLVGGWVADVHGMVIAACVVAGLVVVALIADLVRASGSAEPDPEPRAEPEYCRLPASPDRSRDPVAPPHTRR